jgi:hypothetical protein
MCDLAFFRSLDYQAKRIKRRLENMHGIDKILRSVKDAFNENDGNTSISCYGHLYAVYNTILAHHGNNDFNNPHANVRKRLRNGRIQLIKTVAMKSSDLISLKDETNGYFSGEF